MDPDTRYATGLLAELRERDVPPLDVDVDRAVTTGRRRVRVRRAVVGGLAAATGLLAVSGVLVAVDPLTEPDATRRTDPPAATGLPACTVRALPVPAGATHVMATAVAPGGRYVVGHAAASEETGEQGAALLWDGDAVRNLDVPGFAAAASAVNSAGTVAGTVTRNHDLVAWVYRDGQVATLPTLNGRPSSVSGINERGDIAGIVYGADDVTTAVVWPADKPGTVRALTAPGPTGVLGPPGSTGAVAIAADGTVLGYAPVSGNSTITQPYLWQPDGTGRALPAPPGVKISRARAVAGDWAVGVGLETPDRSVPAARWNLRDGRVEQLPSVSPSSVTVDGVVIGMTAEPGPDRPWMGAARVDANGTVTALPHIDAKRNTGLALAATADGRVIVGGEDSDRSAVPVRWDC
jgi:hypothetical protein